MNRSSRPVIRGSWHCMGLALLGVAVAAGRAAAGDGIYVWQGTADASWNTGANWDEGSPPTAADNVFLPTPSAAISTIVMGSGGAAADLFVQGQYGITAGTLSFGNLLVGSDTTATLVVSNGGALSGLGGSVGYSPTQGPSTLIVSGSGGGGLLTTTNTLNVGYEGANHRFDVVASGTASLGPLWIGGLSASSDNAVNVLGAGSRLSSSQLMVGYAGEQNNMIVGDGATLVTTAAYLSYESTSTQNGLLITGGGTRWLHSGPLQVGGAGTGSMLQVDNGAAVSITGSSDVEIGVTATAESNAIVVSAGTFSAPAAIVVGKSGSYNVFVVESGATVTSALGRLGVEAGSDGNAATVSGAGSSWTVNGTVRAGGLGDGNALQIEGGGLMTVTGGNNLWVGHGIGSDDNLVTVTGAGSTLRLTGFGGEVVVSGNGGTNNRFVIADSGTVATDSVKLGPGGTLQIGDPDNAAPAAGFLAPGATITGVSSSFFASAGTVDFRHTDAEYGFANRMTGGLEVVHSGSGRTVLTTASDYTGPTRILAGTLALSGTGSITSSGTITVGAGAMFDLTLASGTYELAVDQLLEGEGTVDGDLRIAAGAAIVPGIGAVPGTLAITGNLDLAGTLAIKISGTQSGLLSLASGLLTLDGSSSLLFLEGDPLTEDVYVFGTYGTLDGTFAAVNGVPTGYALDMNYLGGGQMALVAVPEPASVTLAAVAALCGLGWRRARRRGNRAA